MKTRVMYAQAESGKDMESSVVKWKYLKYWNSSKIKAHKSMVKKI